MLGLNEDKLYESGKVGKAFHRIQILGVNEELANCSCTVLEKLLLLLHAGC